MKKLREIANMGKTIIITAHTVSNLHLCDKILFMGKEGKVCYYGSYEEILHYFKVKEFVDIYDLLKDDTDSWYLKYRENESQMLIDKTCTKEKRKQAGFVSQVSTLVKRYISSLINNKFMLILLLGQAIMMGFLICLATEKNCLSNSVTASMIFVAFTLAAVWLGLFNTIQEIVKEKDMLKKEYMSGLKFTSYMVSKIIIFSILCLYQSIACVSIVYFHLNPRPDTVLVTNTLVDLIINFFLVSFSTSMIGIFISSFVKDTKTTLILSPLYMMIQMLFSGMFIPFIEFTKNISYFVIARWGYENFGTISNLKQYQVTEPSKDFFLFQSSHVLNIWFIFIVILALFLIASIVTIKLNILKQDRNYLKFHNKKIVEE